MPRQILEIGTTPGEEQCAQTGSKTYDAGTLQRLECKAYILALTRKYGAPPEDSRLYTKATPHDFGTYHEVAYSFDRDNEAHQKYAAEVENGLGHWDDAQMWPPICWGGDHPANIVDDVARLPREVSPELLRWTEPGEQKF